MSLYDSTDINVLVEECKKNHSDDAFDEIVRRYTPMLKSTVLGYSNSSCFDYDELFAEACVALHSAVMRYDTTQSEVTFGLFARICVYRRIISHLKSDDFRRCVVSDGIEQIVDHDTLESGVADRDTADRLMECARTILSDYEYRVLVLHIQGYKTADIAKMLSRTPKSVDNAKSRVFRRLRSAVE